MKDEGWRMKELLALTKVALPEGHPLLVGFVFFNKKEGGRA